MNKRSWAAVAILAAIAGAWGLADYSAAQPRAKDQESKDVFGLTKMHQFHLELSAKEWAKMQPAGGGMRGPGGGPAGFGGPGGPPQQPQVQLADKSTDVHKGGSFGIEFPWVHADLTAQDKTYKDVALRYKGGGSYMPSSGQLKRNLKIDLNRYDEDQRFHSLKVITLNSEVMDATRFREVLAYAVYRAAGVPAPRTAFAQVNLTVPGKYDKEFVGLYTFVENVDKNFLKDRFGDGKGLLLKPERRPGAGGARTPFDYVGEDWDRYKALVGPKREPSKKEARRVIEFAKLINQAGDDQFQREIGSYLDVDEFLRFLAVTSMVCNMDSIFTIGHNAMVYLNPETDKFVFIPWDLDLSFGSFFMFGSADQQADMSLTHPYPGEYKLVDRLLAWKETGDKYKKVLKELAVTCFSKEKLFQDLDILEMTTKEIISQEKKAVEDRREDGFGFGPKGGGKFGSPMSLRSFLEKRTVSVMAQVEGNSKGYVPIMGFGPGGPGGFGMQPPRPGELLPRPLQDMLRLSELQKKQLGELQKDLETRLTKILNDEQNKQLKEMRERGPGGFGPPGGPGFGPPGGFPGGPPPAFNQPKKEDKSNK